MTRESGIDEANSDDGRQAFTDVLTGEVLLHPLEQVLSLGIVVDGSSQGRAETGQMGPAISVEDGVGERQDILRIPIVPLERDLDLLTVVGLFIEIDGLRVEHRLRSVEIMGELRKAPLETKFLFPL